MLKLNDQSQANNTTFRNKSFILSPTVNASFRMMYFNKMKHFGNLNSLISSNYMVLFALGLILMHLTPNNTCRNLKKRLKMNKGFVSKARVSACMYFLDVAIKNRFTKHIIKFY